MNSVLPNEQGMQKTDFFRQQFDGFFYRITGDPGTVNVLRVFHALSPFQGHRGTRGTRGRGFGELYSKSRDGKKLSPSIVVFVF
jgi:hypothetical protein